MIGVKFIAPGAAQNVYEVTGVEKQPKRGYFVKLHNITKNRHIELPLENFQRIQSNHVLKAPTNV